MPVTYDDLYIGPAVPVEQDWGKIGDRRAKGYKLSCPIWLKTDLVGGLPTRWPRAVADMYIPAPPDDKRHDTYIALPETMRERIRCDLLDDDIHKLFVDDVIEEAQDA